ncbi:MAG: glycosyltransferase, partial [Candidatus Adiutrix sp.]|nr:glycosyltransferase [Candidatus Adiutrix sp.]
NCLALQAADPEVKIVRLWRNFGHETAMAAGLDYASGEAVVFLDADLQHPPELVRAMVELWRGGQDLVLTRRRGRAGASAWRRWGSRLFYRLLNFLSERPLPEGAPDFRLLGAKYVKFLKSFNERDYLFRGLLAWGVPLDQAAVLEFSAPPRLAGESKYGFFKSLGLAMNSILQFSVKPLFLSLWLAGLTTVFAVILGLQVVAERYVLNNPTPGFATIVLVTLIMGASNLIALAIMGAYIAKIHLETKKRPPYLADFITAEETRSGQAGAEENPAAPDGRP